MESLFVCYHLYSDSLFPPLHHYKELFSELNLEAQEIVDERESLIIGFYTPQMFYQDLKWLHSTTTTSWSSGATKYHITKLYTLALVLVIDYSLLIPCHLSGGEAIFMILKS